MSALVPSPASATSWARITSSGYYSGKITHYYCDNGSFRNALGECQGAHGTLVDVGNVAVYFMTEANHDDPIAKYGTTVSLPSSITLKRTDGTNRTSRYFTIWDTGRGADSSGRGWVDVLAGDTWYNPYAADNGSLISSTFEDGQLKSIYFDLSTAP